VNLGDEWLGFVAKVLDGGVEVVGAGDRKRDAHSPVVISRDGRDVSGCALGVDIVVHIVKVDKSGINAGTGYLLVGGGEVDAIAEIADVGGGQGGAQEH